jgi:hypothetical protein
MPDPGGARGAGVSVSREWRVRAFGPAFGRRRLRRRSQPDLVATASGPRMHRIRLEWLRAGRARVTGEVDHGAITTHQ